MIGVAIMLGVPERETVYAVPQGLPKEGGRERSRLDGLPCQDLVGKVTPCASTSGGVAADKKSYSEERVDYVVLLTP